MTISCTLSECDGLVPMTVERAPLSKSEKQRVRMSCEGAIASTFCTKRGSANYNSKDAFVCSENREERNNCPFFVSFLWHPHVQSTTDNRLLLFTPLCSTPSSPGWRRILPSSAIVKPTNASASVCASMSALVAVLHQYEIAPFPSKRSNTSQSL